MRQQAKSSEEQVTSDSKDLVVFSILRDSECSECKQELLKGSLLSMEKGRPLCTECADLDHLVWLPSGDAALTRRAKKHSKLWAVIVKFSRARKRYERQGLLVEEEALAQAQEECLADEELREARRVRDALRRADEDMELARAMQAKLMEMFPGCPAKDAESIARHTSERSSGRVGRSEAGRNLDEEALRLAAIAYIRHRRTNYDELLMRGVDRSAARLIVRDKIDEIVERWNSR
ncbi:MAG TPA: DUF2293 domain-containing protein [Candidatus Solibacter sp.]|nr:DUF2293 domain-containing protein [Candidatus Solibacter sp.]